MPQPADVTAAAERLIDIYRASRASLTAQLAEALQDPSRWRQVARLRAMLATLGDIERHLLASTSTWLSTTLPEVHALGAAHALGERAFTWTQPHITAVTELATSTWADVAPRLQQMTHQTRRAIRELTADAARQTLVEGRTAAQSSRTLEVWMRQHGIHTVTYHGGAVHDVSDYADTVARTTSATAYNDGELTQVASDGIGWVEVFDGPDCGWVSHDDIDKANGTIRSLADAQAHPLSHPRCARSFGPRPDITSAAEAEIGRQFTPEEQARMAAEEAERARLSPVTLSGRARTTRGVRESRLTRVG